MGLGTILTNSGTRDLIERENKQTGVKTRGGIHSGTLQTAPELQGRPTGVVPS